MSLNRGIRLVNIGYAAYIKPYDSYIMRQTVLVSKMSQSLSLDVLLAIFSVQINHLDSSFGNSLFFYRCSALNIEGMRPMNREIDSDLCHHGESKADLPH